MGHPKELLDKIARDLQHRYSPEKYTYIYEKGLRKYASKAPKRIQPDIIVLDHRKVVCVVEIGYTRPEKIRDYRKLKIRDTMVLEGWYVGLM